MTLIRNCFQSSSFFVRCAGKFFASPPPCHSERSRTFGLVPKARGLPSGISAVVWDVRCYHCLSARSLLDALRRLARTKHIVARLARRRRAVVRVIDAQCHRDPCSHCINIEFRERALPAGAKCSRKLLYPCNTSSVTCRKRQVPPSPTGEGYCYPTFRK